MKSNQKKYQVEESLYDLLEKHDVNFKIVAALKVNIVDHEYHKITVVEFINHYNVRMMLGWRNLGMKGLFKLAEVMDDEGLSLKF